MKTTVGGNDNEGTKNCAHVTVAQPGTGRGSLGRSGPGDIISGERQRCLPTANVRRLVTLTWVYTESIVDKQARSLPTNDKTEKSIT